MQPLFGGLAWLLPIWQNVLDRGIHFFVARKLHHQDRHQHAWSLTLKGCDRILASGNWLFKGWRLNLGYCCMQSLEGIAVIHPKKLSLFAHVLLDLSRRSSWLRPKSAGEVVQYCKNCLLVSIHCLFPPRFACGSSWRLFPSWNGKRCNSNMITDVELMLKGNNSSEKGGDDTTLKKPLFQKRGGDFWVFQP